MPNTPASVGAGMIQYCTSNVTAEEARVPEIDGPRPGGWMLCRKASSTRPAAVSGCRAWVYQFIEALADGGVACGLPRAKAQEYAAQMVLGSAKLVLESGQHPARSRTPCAAPAAAPSRACGCWKKKACGAR